ncbi:hypothetical protein TNCV_1281191 [Trichonephila clavipes]|nr:hypothetical protein TNCV_1281191 [Trichonephila clavipes]
METTGASCHVPSRKSLELSTGEFSGLCALICTCVSHFYLGVLVNNNRRRRTCHPTSGGGHKNRRESKDEGSQQLKTSQPALALSFEKSVID